MLTVCSYCAMVMNDADPAPEGLVSHGICETCADYHLPPILELNLSTHLNKYPQPVILVDPAGRVMAINEAMSTFLEREQHDGLALLGGELLGCRYAVLEGGCGKTVHCPGCSIRNTVERSRAQQADMVNVEVAIDGAEFRMHLLISTYPRDEFVKVVMEKILRLEPLPEGSLHPWEAPPTSAGAPVPPAAMRAAAG